MPRTIVYAQPRSIGITRHGLGTPTAPEPTAPKSTGDGYTERLSKYIPAEVLAAFLPLVGLTGNRGLLLRIAFVVGLIATVMYLYIHALQETDSTKRPRWFFYPLAVAAFIAWAVGTSDAVRGLFGWDEIDATFALAMAAFAIPVLDLLIDRVSPRKAA